ncbi:leucyl/phenylalanyl-tRNA--protein transferase [Rubricella aquisinus]|uniref:Leucyl/phenylalanyl-tRNA--protein transferase n=1 Tax=Rubricella aquisinus TaxID=2028108 RepID=A0A840WYL3_9RHOB|nr:leucyl/phenylalanyl-tRNA--protein transferase [Rubricella aquisinus]MBB5514756.1 leucyl/phenylalanyl-tRNA--protein transferase [Rubricella aquisinus]
MPRDDFFEITPSLLLQAYASGVFPMAEPDDDTVRWIDPLARGIIPLDGLHISRSLKKQILRGGFRVTTDTCFEQVMRACADRDETWISEELIAAYVGLHQRGYAHSVEIWDEDGALIGGLYGVRIGAAFFGESMFSRARSASRIALVWLVAQLRTRGFTLLDTQFLTDHLVSMGAVEISRAEYHAHLYRALRRHSDWGALSIAASSAEVIQRATQMS